MEDSPSRAQTGFIASLSSLSKHKILVIGVVSVVVLIIGVLVFVLMQQDDQTNEPDGASIVPPASYPHQLREVPAPEITFKTINNSATTPELPEIMNVYTLKKDFSETEVQEKAYSLKLTQQKKPSDGYTIFYDTQGLETKGVSTFHQPTGSFTVESYGILKSQSSSQSKTEIAQSFLQEMGVGDSTVLCNITYTKKAMPDVTYVECHRSWERVGLPIYNIVGLLNTSPNEPVSSQKLGYPDKFTPTDPDIANVSTGSQADGRMRKNDFNTATVAVKSDNSILLAESNLKTIIKTERYTKANFITPDEAFEKFENNEAQLTLSLPAGVGPVEWEKVYQNKQVTAENAVITDFVLSYLETPSTSKQDLLVPMYTFRGEAHLDSGYRVTFVSTVPALKNGKSFLAYKKSPLQAVMKFFNNLSPQVFAADDNDSSLQLRTFTPAPVQLGEPPAGENYSCELGHVTPPLTEAVIDIPGLGKLEVYYNNQHTYFLKQTHFPAKDMKDVKEAFRIAVEEQYVTNVARYGISEGEDPKEVFKKMNGASCPRSALDNGAPVYDCEVNFANSEYKKILDIIANNVSEKLRVAVREGTISQLASRPNLFPSGTRYLSATLYGYDYNSRNSCYISGTSPSVFFYPQIKTAVTVTLPDTLTYIYPPTQGTTSKFVAHPDGSLDADTALPLYSLYYEYDSNKVTFPKKQEGYIVSDEEVMDVVSQIARKAKLLDHEKKALILDVENALIREKKSSYYRISVLTSSDVSKQLPLVISPRPDTLYRLHVHLHPVTNLAAIQEPHIAPIHRSGFTVVEIGARYQ